VLAGAAGAASRWVTRLHLVESRDRLLNLALLGAAVAAWVLVAILGLRYSPKDDPSVQFLGAALIGTAAGLTATPLLWLAAFARHRRIAYRGDWFRATRRGLWVGFLVALYVILRAQDAFSLPLLLFVVALVLIVELSLSVER
jgi:hypothetical protein